MTRLYVPACGADRGPNHNRLANSPLNFLASRPSLEITVGFIESRVDWISSAVGRETAHADADAVALIDIEQNAFALAGSVVGIARFAPSTLIQLSLSSASVNCTGAVIARM